MKKILALGIAVAMMMAFVIPATAGPTDTLIIYLNNDASADILVENATGGDATWYPSAGIGANEASGLTDYNCSNNGSVQVDIDIKGSVAGGWALGSSAGHDTLYVAYNWTGNTWTEITTGDLDFSDDMAHDGYQLFGIMVDMPTSTSTGDAQTVTLTFTATAD